MVTAEATDTQQLVHQLPVEFVGSVKTFVPVVPEAPTMTQTIVRIPESITNAGDLSVRITARGRTSNAVVSVKP
ncbi:MAG TPA: hypothetical protein VFD62_19755 [Pyrinomonadaceae bacterium]|nr:hypothetical protein [Pyrinomonadaceae bacterium]